MMLQVHEYSESLNSDKNQEDDDFPDEESEKIFEGIYDDIYEVVLPNTLWGLHRDPNRKFIAFSMFNSETMSATRLLHVSNNLELKTYLYNAMISKDVLKDLSAEILSNILSELDEYNVCKSLKSSNANEDCQLVTADENFCINCLQNQA